VVQQKLFDEEPRAAHLARRDGAAQSHPLERFRMHFHQLRGLA
jgi:hypothetical protein